MPWKIVGKCVHKENPDGSTGEKVKCHNNVEEAKAHLRALYANYEGKSLNMDNEIIYFGKSYIKSLKDEEGEIGEYSVVFGDKNNKDFHGNYFTKDTFLGHNQGNGSVGFINHRVPLFKKGQFDTETEKALKAITDMRLKNPIQTSVDDIGVFSKLVLDLSDKYEKMVYELTKKGVFKWSSGTAPQTYKALPDGGLEMFVIAEQSLTPIPAEYRMLSHRVMPLKAYTKFLQQSNKSESTLNRFFKGYSAIESFEIAMKHYGLERALDQSEEYFDV